VVVAGAAVVAARERGSSLVVRSSVVPSWVVPSSAASLSSLSSTVESSSSGDASSARLSCLSRPRRPATRRPLRSPRPPSARVVRQPAAPPRIGPDGAVCRPDARERGRPQCPPCSALCLRTGVRVPVDCLSCRRVTIVTLRA
jgi:hypothetical protein